MARALMYAEPKRSRTNTLKNVERRAGNSHDGSTGGALGLDGFAKIIFGSATCHFFTKQVGKKRESAPPGREREFSGVVISCGSQIGRN
jgi:hypothetical protein